MIYLLHRFVHFIILSALMPIAFSLIAQDLEEFKPPALSRDSLLTIAHTIIDSAQSRTLITVDEQGKPQARIMSPFPPDENMVIWLGTNPRSRKVKQIKNNPHVMVFYYNTDGYSYVSIAGQAQIVNDPEKRAHYWKEDWTRFYPDPEKDYTLIKVIPQRMEICSFEYELFWDKNGLPAFVVF